MFTPIKPKSSGVLNDTVLSTPLPQATSTVRRKAILESKFNDNLQSTEEKSKQDLLYDNESTQKEDNSLGLLDNMSDLTNISTAEDEQKLNFSNIDAELEIARKLLQRCSDKNSVLTTDTNKENNANMQNITSNMPVSNFILPIEACMSELDKECNMSHSTSVTFEPNEITARSSGVSSSAKRQSLINLSFHGISFNKNDIMALNNEMMSEEFLSNSKGAEQLSMDQTCFAPHNLTYCMPGMKTEKQKIDFSTLSGIIGELDLSIESCAGRKVSVGRYFERKSDDIEMLGNGKAKPNLKVLETPIKTGKLPVLVESTVSTEATTSSMKLTEKEHALIPNITRDIDENSIISLSTIVNTLEDVNSETPRRLVDQLLMAQKKKNHSLIVSFPPNENVMKTESFTNVSKKKMLEDSCNENVVSSINQDIGVSSTSDLTFSLQNSTLPCNDKLTALSYVQFKMNRKSFDEESYKNLNIQNKEQNISNNMISSSLLVNNMDMQTDSKNIVLGKNTEEACNCVVGLTNEVNVELINNGDRWITYIFKLIEVVGDTQSIELNIPSKEILINSNSTQSTKIEVKVLKMCKPIFVILNIFLSDMVAKSKWSMKHIIFVNPEQLELDIVCPSDKQNLDFQYIGEETIKILPITFYNKNNVAVPVKLSILEEGSKIFSIDGPTHFLLEPLKKFITNIKCEKSRSTSFCYIDSPQRQPQHWKGKLIVYVQSKDDIILLKKEIPLYAQIGFCKIQIVNTEIPIVVPRQQGKSINIINSGNIAIHVFASIVPFEGHSNATQDFFIKPDDIFLQVAERSSFLIVYKPQFSDANSVNNERYAKIKLVAGNNVYHYIISTEQKLLESEKENYLRCHTPNNVVSLSPATSPQSITSNRSGPCDRNSPISTVSSSAVAGHVIPIRATHAALVWNSVKTGKSETKEFTIRNTSNNKIKIQIEICDDSKSFKFLGDKQTINTSLVLVMQRQEIKTLAVVFNPYSVGSVVGKITIKHYTRESSDSQQFKRIPLYGYGGCSKLKISGPFKDSSKKLWLSLGNLYSETMTLNASIRLDNIGDLRSFAKVTIIPKVISPIMDSSWHINPKEIILNSKDSQEITIQFHPKKEDFASLQRSEVSHVATLNVIYGDEPTRWRIRRLYNKLKQSGESIRNENEAFKNIVHPICKHFPGEQLIPGITLIRDSILNLNDLCTGVHQYEIMLTVEACADDTLPVHYDTDESEMYQSLISDTTHLDEAGGASFFASQTIEYEVQHPELQGDQFTVTPSTITLIPPVKNEATVTILSFFKTAEPFQTSLSNSDYFSVVPAEGMLPSKKSFPLKIQCSQKLDRNMQAVLAIYTENNKQDVLIKVTVRR
ncbi:CE192 protein, partial [Acromyrmex heyeri]